MCFDFHLVNLSVRYEEKKNQDISRGNKITTLTVLNKLRYTANTIKSIEEY